MWALNRTYSFFNAASLPSRIPIALGAEACWSTPPRKQRSGGRRPQREHGGDRGTALSARVANAHARLVTGELCPDRIGEPRHQHDGERPEREDLRRDRVEPRPVR